MPLIKSLLCLLTITNIYTSLAITATALIYKRNFNIFFFCFLLSSVASNLKGMHTPFNYILFLLTSLAFLIFTKKIKVINNEVILLIALISFIQIYGMILSIIFLSNTGSVNYLEVFASTFFSVLFPIIGLLSAKFAHIYKQDIFSTIGILTFFMFSIVLLKYIEGPLFLTPETSEEVLLAKKQLTDTTGNFTLRIFGPTIGPNSLGLMCYFFAIILLTLSIKTNFIKEVFLGIMALATLSKTVVAIFFIYIAIYFFIKPSVKYKVILIFILSTLGTTVFISTDLILEAFRINSDITDIGSRTHIYQHMTSEFPLTNYFMGIGPHSWREYFNTNLQLDIQDPHSLVFSVPGSYGVFGVIFYLYLTYKLIRKFFLSKNIQIRSAAIGLILVALFRDFFSIPTPLGTTHFTFLFWFIYGLIITSKTPMTRN